MTYKETWQRADRLRKIPLEAVLLVSGAARDRYDKAKWHTHRGALSVTGMKFFNWNQGVGGGGAIDLAMHWNGLPFQAALEWLAHHFPSPSPRADLQPPRPRVPLKLPPRDGRHLSRVRRYLLHDRRLPPGLLDPLIESGALYADSRGNAVFLLLGKGGRPVGAEIRGTTPHPWHGMAPGSRKDLGYFSTLGPHAKPIVLCESAIDALSCSALHPDRRSISTSGARPDSPWLSRLLRAGHDLYCGFDADATGDDMARAMIAHHPSVRRLRPALKDWNDVLTSSR